MMRGGDEESSGGRGEVKELEVEVVEELIVRGMRLRSLGWIVANHHAFST